MDRLVLGGIAKHPQTTDLVWMIPVSPQQLNAWKHLTFVGVGGGGVGMGATHSHLNVHASRDPGTVP